jgi:DegV family protein with EDD domain
VIALVTDSNSQIPPSLVERYGITVVPLPVNIDGVDYLEGVDIDADDFYRRFECGTPAVATAQPSPGQFAAVYDRLVAEGAEGILSVHIGSVVSGTINAARLAAASGSLTVPVRIVDTATASFAITLCAWAAAEALAAGADMEDAAVAAEQTASTVGNVFVVRALDQARQGGRLAAGQATPDAAAIPVLSMDGGVMRVVGQATDITQVADLMAAHVRAAGQDLRVGIGVSDAAVVPMWDELERRLVGVPEVRELVRYRVGPSVGVHTGPGTVGAMYAPAR